MLLKTEDKKDLELSFRLVADPTEIINEKIISIGFCFKILSLHSLLGNNLLIFGLDFN